MTAWHVYLVRARDGSLYAGVTTDVTRRLAEHGEAGGRGAKCLRSRGPLDLAYEMEVGEREIALRAEARIKRLTKRRKEEIAASKPSAGELLQILNLQAPP